MSERKHAGLNSLGICTDVFTLQPRPALGFGRMFCNIQKIAFKTIHIARLPSREDSASKRDDRTTYDMAHRAAMHRPPAAPLRARSLDAAHLQKLTKKSNQTGD